MSRVKVSLPEVQWRTAAAQLTIIVAGVLVALLAQAFWNRFQDGRREAEYLQQIRADLVLTLTNLTLSQLVQERSVARAERMVQALHSSGELPPSDSLVRWASHNLGYAELVTGTLDALIQTGDIHLIRDDSIRIGLIRYSAAMANARTSQTRVGSAYFERSSAARRALESHSTFVPVSWREKSYKTQSIDVQGIRADFVARASFLDVWLTVRDSAAGMRRARLDAIRLLAVMDKKRSS